MSILKQNLEKACSDLGLAIELDYTLCLKNGERIQALAFISNQTLHGGVLVVDNYISVKKYIDILSEMNIGFSVLDEPGSRRSFDIKVYQRMFEEWGLLQEME